MIKGTRRFLLAPSGILGGGGPAARALSTGGRAELPAPPVVSVREHPVRRMSGSRSKA